MAYSVIYTPEKNAFDANVNFVCSDNKVHFRFRDFQKNEHVQGFERKLVYLMEYLFNFCYTPSLTDKTAIDDKILLDDFMKTKDVYEISRIISEYVPNKNFKGIRAYLNYNKKSDIVPFGKVREGYFPIIGTNSLKDFQRKLRVSISDFLFNDKYSILLHDGYKSDANRKFKNKFNSHKTNESEDDVWVKLW